MIDFHGIALAGLILLACLIICALTLPKGVDHA